MFYVAMVAGITAGVITLLKRGIIGSLGSSAIGETVSTLASVLLAISGIVCFFGALFSLGFVLEHTIHKYVILLYIVMLFYLFTFIFSIGETMHVRLGEDTRLFIWHFFVPFILIVGAVELLSDIVEVIAKMWYGLKVVIPTDISPQAIIFFLAITFLDIYIIKYNERKMEAWRIISPILEEKIKQEFEALDPPKFEFDEIANEKGKVLTGNEEADQRVRSEVKELWVKKKTDEKLFILYRRMIPDTASANEIIEKYGKKSGNGTEATESTEPKSH